jgi:hypothetical protein
MLVALDLAQHEAAYQLRWRLLPLLREGFELAQLGLADLRAD